MNHVSTPLPIPVLATDALVAYFALLRDCGVGVASGNCGSARDSFHDTISKWGDTMRGLCGSHSRCCCVEGGREGVCDAQGCRRVDGVTELLGVVDSVSAEGACVEEEKNTESSGAAGLRYGVEATVDASPLAGGGVGVKSSTLTNRAKRQSKKLRKVRKQAGDGVSDCRKPVVSTQVVTPARYVAGLVNSDDDAELKDSVKRKWVIKNKLEIAKAERELAILKGGDIEDDVRKKNIVTRAAIERNIVAIEKCHASLRGSDTHTPDDEARVITVLSGIKSDSISPDSSASRSEYMRQKKLCEDKDVELAEKDKAIGRLTQKLREMGVDVTGVEDVAKSEWTVDVSGQVTQEHQQKFSDYGYSWTTGFNEPRLCPDGKERIRVDFFD